MTIAHNIFTLVYETISIRNCWVAKDLWQNDLDWILIRKYWYYTKVRYFSHRGRNVKLEETFFDKMGWKQLFVCCTVDNFAQHIGMEGNIHFSDVFFLMTFFGFVMLKWLVFLLFYILLPFWISSLAHFLSLSLHHLPHRSLLHCCVLFLHASKKREPSKC